MVALSGQRFVQVFVLRYPSAYELRVGVNQADETRGVRPRRVNRAVKQRDRPYSACMVRLNMV
jgi:hypothetical protein